MAKNNHDPECPCATDKVPHGAGCADCSCVKESSDEEKTKAALAMREDIAAVVKKYEGKEWLQFVGSALNEIIEEIDSCLEEIGDVE